jgi:hypothetical protein
MSLRNMQLLNKKTDSDWNIKMSNIKIFSKNQYLEYKVIITLEVSSKTIKEFHLSQWHGISQFFTQYRKVPFCAFNLPMLHELPHDNRHFLRFQKSILLNFGNTADDLSSLYQL